MRVRLSSARRMRGLGMAYGLLVLAGFATVRLWPGGVALVPVCPWRAFTGFPCPFCQGTHAFVALASGRLGEAFRANPLASAVDLALLLWGAVDVFGMLTGQTLSIHLGRQEKTALWLLLAGALLANWLYLIAVLSI